MQAYDPLDYDNLAKSVVQALLDTPKVSLPPHESFQGAGVYAVYYHGDFDHYSPIVTADPCPPIYVGMAAPAGSREGGRQPSSGEELYQRLRQHARSIEHTKNLRLAHFGCRYLVVVPVWITLAERFLVEYYKPVWNVVIDGFGNHDPGAGRHAMKKPRWDILHPGRPWATKLTAEESLSQVLERLERFLKRNR